MTLLDIHEIESCGKTFGFPSNHTQRFHIVRDVPAMHQPVFAACHIRNRTSRLHRELLRIVKAHFSKP